MKYSYLTLSIMICTPVFASTIVTNDNFIEAETNTYFSELMTKVPVNTWRHARNISSKDFQFVIRENQDILYSHAVVDVSKGATLSVPQSGQYQIIQVIDEKHYTVAVIYPGESLIITPNMLSKGTHVFLNARTGIMTPDSAGVKRANLLQDQLKIEANSNQSYVDKDFDKISQDKLRSDLEKYVPEVKAWLGFGNITNKMLDSKQRLYVAAAGWGGLPAKDAFYFPLKGTENQECRSLTFDAPPLNYEKGGFWSITIYDDKGWIAKDNFALNNFQAKANNDGSYTLHFNCGAKALNNIDTIDGNWQPMFRAYLPRSFDEILKYSQDFTTNVTFK
ncbi:DUF1214 domain-containing protein [Aliivibrio fischeri]|uniref:DUF1214 domain-containing protein n=1 Tax=Aliivibrio fischeri TaxID=668 RepID=UPI0007C4AEC3|nr:DUF1214 domain-containing protein [Aliivibrio fischeri]